MSYINDNPWPVLIALACVAIIAFLSGTSKGPTVAIVSLLLACGLYFVEQALISPGEEVEIEVATMLDNFKARDIDAIADQLAEPNEKLAGIAQQGLNMVDISETFAIKSVQVTLDGETKATAMVRANGNVSLRQQGGGQHRVPNYWKTEWRHERGSWKLAAVTRLNPINGTEMGYFSAQ